jgi:gamma-glutamylcyclotransferase (GGCT)/AIG2-like uncharacterized protein YtfP
MLYFFYDALMEPPRLAEVAPTAQFRFVAHLPETRLCFPQPGGQPSVVPDPGHTVWGAVFEISSKEAAAITSAEAREGREPGMSKAVDREGNKYEVLTHAHPMGKNGEHKPSASYMAAVVAGARNWGLPTGWIAGLEEYGEDLLF